MRIIRRLGSGRLPSSARTELGLAAGERVIAYAVTRGEYVAATDRALRTTTGLVIGWEHIEYAQWHGGTLFVREVVPLGEHPREHQFSLADPGNLPDVVRERVTASIVVSQHAKLDATRGVRIAARRRPGTSDVVWVVVFDAGLDPTEPETRARAEEALHRIRQQTGL